ncbi:Malonyl CoA-acyl carrier protein transacylase [Labilithrix luteola]|uniref:Malonyl CoA-acyl carrier protein transacylase n=1 Tax=Labilithrix luteola TaxID=1391654 RepID=A0A0K1PR01_9BACT|nr:ACP S-malonyltransferase [Labilithrix luteola]AKU95801.1 Malonyl CoA-acyl carrier protein transacylase [Labilithrix luteola]
MSFTAVVFPGQGSQRVGMASDFCARFDVSRNVFAEASDALGIDMAAMCFDDDPRLDLTEYTQPAILTAEIAMLRALEHNAGLRPTHWGGHSLGEYTALCAAGVIPLATAVRLVRRRGALMQQGVPAGEGAMMAIIAEGIADRELSSELDGLDVDTANRNSPGQIVLSGKRADVERAASRIACSVPGVELVPLNVSAPFHSRMMRGIESAFRAELDAVAGELAFERAGAVTSNLTGGFHVADREAVLDALTRQISGTVDFIANMRVLASAADRICEVGPGRPLRGFFRAIGRDVASVVSVKHVAEAA